MKICNTPNCPNKPKGHHKPPEGSHKGVHGMVVFGDGFFSHLPMFHEPHDYQILLDVKLNHPQLQGTENFGQELHTFVPNKFALGDLLNGKLERLEGTLYQGNFEQGGQPLLEKVEVEVEQIMRSEHLSADSQGHADLQYWLCGKPEDTYLVHRIQGNSGFDQILKVECQGMNVSPQELASGVLVQIPGRANLLEQRLRGGEVVSAREQVDGVALEIQVDRELSTLVGPDFSSGPS